MMKSLNKPETNMVAYIDYKKCDQSPLCPAQKACPVGAISQHTSSCSSCSGGLSVVDPAKCTGCGICTENCPGKAIKLVEIK